MLFRVKQRLARSWFDAGVRSIVESPHVICDPSGRFVLVSQICHRDVLMFLVALKSFVQYLKPTRVVVLDDSTLTSEDKLKLRTQIDRVEILPVRDFASDRCPRDGCWERLLFICSVVQENYIVQLDADTITLGP